jgi:hypothetical protein
MHLSIESRISKSPTLYGASDSEERDEATNMAPSFFSVQRLARYLGFLRSLPLEDSFV